MKAYYAHCIAIYDTAQEDRDLTTIRQLGYEPVNPNCPECAEGYKKEGMAFFKKFVDECYVIVFRALPDGAIPAGVASEIEYFVRVGKPVIELPSQMSRRVLSIEQTREYLQEVGQR